MKALEDLSIDLDSKEVVELLISKLLPGALIELLISKLLPGALVERTETPGVKHRVIGYNKEEGYVIITTGDADELGWCSFTPGDSVTIQGYEEVRKVYVSLGVITVSDDLADYIEEQVAAMKPRTLDPLGSIFNLNDPRVVEALGTLLVGVNAEVGTTGSQGIIMEVNGLEAKLSIVQPMSLAQSDLIEEETDADVDADADADADDIPSTFNISLLRVFKSY